MKTHAEYDILKHAELLFLGDSVNQLVTDIKHNTFSNSFFKYKNLIHLATFPEFISLKLEISSEHFMKVWAQ